MKNLSIKYVDTCFDFKFVYRQSTLLKIILSIKIRIK